jgi:hypothetical protein
MTAHVDDIGTVVRTVVKKDGEPRDISWAVHKEFRVVKKGKTSVIWEPVFDESNGENGVLLYTIKDGDFDVASEYKIQLYLQDENGNQWHTDIPTFSVEGNNPVPAPVPVEE